MPDTQIQSTNTQPLAVATGDRGVNLSSLDEMWRFAQYVSKSGLAPKGVNTPEAVVVCIQHGFEVGLRPMQALRGIMVVNNRPSLWGDAMLAVCRSSPAWDESVFEETVEGTGDKMEAACTVGRKGGRPIRRTFSVSDAKIAKLWSKSGPWQEYPKRMLSMRARAFACRDGFPDALCGMACYEEAVDFVDVELASTPQLIEPKRREPFDPERANGPPQATNDSEQPKPPEKEEVAPQAKETPHTANRDELIEAIVELAAKVGPTTARKKVQDNFKLGTWKTPAFGEDWDVESLRQCLDQLRDLAD
jgi:hypothetical protein